MTATAPTGTGTVGTALPRTDAVVKVTGAAAFAGDLRQPRMLHAALVRSTVPHARIAAISSAAAVAMPGVVRVLTAADLDAIVTANRFGPAVKDMPILADGVVRYEGEPVAMVLAEDPGIARAAAAAVDVELDELPVVATIEQAMADGAWLLHEPAEAGELAGGWSSGHDPARNLAGQYHDLRGDPDGALAKAELVLSHEYVLPPLQHYALENHVALAVPEGDDLVVHTANQYPFLMARALARLLGRPESTVRVLVPAVGGSFGSKEFVTVAPLATVGAVATGRPVRVEVTVEEAFRCSGRHGAVVRYTTGVAGGRITARKVELLFDTGAYADQGPRVIRQAGYRSPGPYRIPNLQVDAYAIYTNKVPAGAYRGFGASQPIHGCECHMDELAAALGADPVAWRLDHLLELGDDFAAGDLPLDCDLPEQLRLAVEALGGERSGRLPDGRLTGAGFAVGAKNTASGHLPSSAVVRVHRDGSATVLAAGVEIGQGSHTMLAQVAAETLRCDPAWVRVQHPDTRTTPHDQRTSSSRLTVHLGRAVQEAAEQAAARLCEVAARHAAVAVEDLELSEGAVRGDGVLMTCAEILAIPGSVLGGEAIGVGHVNQPEPSADTAFGLRAGYWEGSVGAARVAVDPDTGVVEVIDYVTVADAGRVINHHGAHGQERGGVMMAIGHALSEELEYEDGALLNPSPVDYRVPLAGDAPARIESLFIERGDGPGPFGSKGLGESSIITVAPAIANAVAAATAVRVRTLPIRPWVVWRELAGEAETVRPA